MTNPDKMPHRHESLDIDQIAEVAHLLLNPDNMLDFLETLNSLQLLIGRELLTNSEMAQLRQIAQMPD